MGPAADRPVHQAVDGARGDDDQPAQQRGPYRRDEQGGERIAPAAPGPGRPESPDSARTTAGTRRVVSSAEVMPSRYRGAPLVTIGLPSSRRREIPTPGQAGRPTEGRLCALPIARTGAGTVDPMIEINAVTKRYGSTTAVSGLTFTVRPRVVTGFLGPNGAGKTTTMPTILALTHP